MRLRRHHSFTSVYFVHQPFVVKNSASIFLGVYRRKRAIAIASSQKFRTIGTSGFLSDAVVKKNLPVRAGAL
jgi:hypothetical protein